MSEKILTEEVTDAEVAQFLKEFDEGKHQLSQKDLDALSTAGFRRSLEMSIEITRLTRQLDEARKREAALVEQLKDAVTWCPDCGGQGWYAINSYYSPPEQCQCERCHGQQAVIAGATCDFIPRAIADGMADALEEISSHTGDADKVACLTVIQCMKDVAHKAAVAYRAATTKEQTK
jgi:hypothetical protein